uniref:Uncharacterized protein n=1 Tax=uncultured prokaryote TaxID=198431 RepID=A0A0H5Q5A1_9ZZZZ|nr:hypothetical protein [uncultured prokaryote]
MAYPRNFLKVVASGTLGLSTEIWSCSLSMAAAGAATQPEDLDIYADAWSAYIARAESGISIYARLDSVKVNLVGADGRYVSKGETGEVQIPNNTVGGANSSQQWPNQCTMAVSLATARARGAGSKGRFFPPMAMTILGSDGRIAPTDAAAMAASADELITTLNTGAGSGLTVVVASAVGAGSLRPVTEVRVGRVPDTQRRRRSALDEDYAVSSVISPGEVPGFTG